jgi:hypothetical protein
MTQVFAKRASRSLLIAGISIFAVAAAHAGPEVTLYITIPFGEASSSHAFGLRLDRAAAPAAVQNFNPTSPLNRRALLDLQLGANSALRLELDRRLTWDIDRQQWRPSSLPATFNVRLPTRVRATPEARDRSAPANPVQDQARTPSVKALAIEP